jgi:hypothetical protein
VRVNGDLGRLGGLLKLWLTDDVRTLQFGEHTICASKAKSTHRRRAACRCRHRPIWRSVRHGCERRWRPKR